MRHFALLPFLAVILLGSVCIAEAQDTMLPAVVLNGADGGTANGEEWNSNDLKGKTQLILYVDPGKKKKATPLIDRIDSLSYSPDTLGINFIVNTKATPMPDVLIRLMIKRRARINDNIQYVLDHNKVLIANRNFTEKNLNILLLDPSGRTRHRYAGEITEEYIDTLIKNIDGALATKQDDVGL